MQHSINLTLTDLCKGTNQIKTTKLHHINFTNLDIYERLK